MRRSFCLLILVLYSCSEGNMLPADEILNNDPLSNNLSVGASAADILSGVKFKKLVLEIQYPEGYDLPKETLEDIKTFFNEHINKPGGVNIMSAQIAVPGKTSYSVQEIREIELANRTQFNTEESIALYLFIANGDYEENDDDSKVLGIAYLNTSMALFQKTIKDLSGGLGKPSERMVTSTVLEHEAGHLLGLVNTGTPMVTDHQDEAHGKHCENTSCLMYWTVNTGDFIDNLLNMSSPPELDEHCRTDLKTNGGK